jgi:hypothetical protein
LLIATPQANADLILTTGPGGSDAEALTGLTLGNAISFEYMYSNVVYTGGSFIGLNATVTNPLLGAFPIGQFNTSRSTNSGWLSAFIDTSIGAGTVHNLVFTANTFGQTGNSATVTIRNIAIDRVLIGVPEPGSIFLIGSGLLAMGLLRRRRP